MGARERVPTFTPELCVKMPEMQFLEPWVLDGSSRHSGGGAREYSFEALIDTNMSTGAGTDKEKSPWFSATFDAPVTVGNVCIGIGLEGDGWNSNYLHGAHIQY